MTTKSGQGRSTLQRALAVVVAGILGLAACSDGGGAEAPVQTSQAAIFSLDPPATVEAGSSSPRAATCPGRKLPDQCGSWAGVELTAARGSCKRHPKAEASVSHCLCEGIDFEIPAQLPVVEGRTGWTWDKPELSFRNAKGKTVTCRYRGNGTPRRGGDAYVFERCSDGSRAGQSAHGDYFELALDDAHPHGEAVTVSVRLGEPDIVGGVVQEQIFYASDPRIAGAALHVPRGSAPPGETFSLTPLRQVPPGTSIDNAGDGLTSLGYAVDVHAESTDNFVFTQVSGASCPRIDLPYDQATALRLLGPGRESDITARQLLNLAGIRRGEHVLEPAGPVTVNLAQRTVSFCVEHLSYWVTGSTTFDTDLISASVRPVAGGTPTNLFTELPPLNIGEKYELTLKFRNKGSTTWTASNVRLVPVSGFSGLSATVLTTTSTWGLEVPPWTAAPQGNTTFTPASVNGPTSPTPGAPLVYSDATFVFNITAPAATTPLNFCLRNLNNAPFGDCFTWDVDDEPAPGTTPPVTVTPQPSCVGLTTPCAGLESCCATAQIPANTTPALATFKLDKYEVTVGRFKKFAGAYDTWHSSDGNPVLGAGAGPTASSGWGSTDLPPDPRTYPDPPPWKLFLPANSAELEAGLLCDPDYQTYDKSDETLPVSCVDWYEAFAFCVWDGGRLPTEDEWEAATSNNFTTKYPWGATPDWLQGDDISSYAVYGGADLAPVGSRPLGRTDLGVADLLGSNWEWTFPWIGFTYGRVLKGGSARNSVGMLYTESREWLDPDRRELGPEPVGFRCAR